MPSKNKEIRNAVWRKWYYKHKAKHNARTKQEKENSRKRLANYKKTLECKKCGESRWPTLHFHHKDPETKYKCVSKMADMNYSWDKILEEINKCIVLCANCHACIHCNDYKNDFISIINS